MSGSLLGLVADDEGDVDEEVGASDSSADGVDDVTVVLFVSLVSSLLVAVIRGL